MTRWVGVDVGGKRKGFDVAVLDEASHVCLRVRLNTAAVVNIVDQAGPVAVAIDSPRCCAPAGMTARPGERELAKEVCGIRWTPDATAVHTNAYYAWIVEGLTLYDALAGRDVPVIEVFPTASWTRWAGPRGSETRAAWTRAGLATLGLQGIPCRTNQDQRDAVAAALTARQHTQGVTQMFGELFVPKVAC